MTKVKRCSRTTLAHPGDQSKISQNMMVLLLSVGCIVLLSTFAIVHFSRIIQVNTRFKTRTVTLGDKKVFVRFDPHSGEPEMSFMPLPTLKSLNNKEKVDSFCNSPNCSDTKSTQISKSNVQKQPLSLVGHISQQQAASHPLKAAPRSLDQESKATDSDQHLAVEDDFKDRFFNSSNPKSPALRIGPQNQSVGWSSNSGLQADICYHYTEQRRCALTPCPGQTAASTHYRGFVRELNNTVSPAALRNRSYGACELCPIYSRLCLVSRAHRFIYLHVMKTGGNSFHGFLHAALCANGTEEGCDYNQLEFFYCNEAMAEFRHYFKWGFVREPVRRAVSYWSMASRDLYGKGVSFNVWAMNHLRLRTRTCKSHRYPQTSFLFGERDNCPMYDFVGTTGPNMLRDIETVLDKINSTALWAHYRAHGFPHAFKSGRNQTDPALRDVTHSALLSLAKRYRDDFANLGFPPPEGGLPDPPPPPRKSGKKASAAARAANPKPPGGAPPPKTPAAAGRAPVQ